MSEFPLKGFIASRMKKAVMESVIDAFIDCGFDDTTALQYADNIINTKVGFCWFDSLAGKLIKDGMSSHEESCVSIDGPVDLLSYGER